MSPVLCGAVLVVTACMLQASTALEWTSSASFPNGTKMEACTGQKVTFPWTFNVTSSEKVVDIEWHYNAGVSTDSLLASYVYGNFLPVPTARQQVHFRPNAGLEIRNVTVADSGVYSVFVVILGDIERQEQIVMLDVSDAPVTAGGQLHASLSPGAVLDQKTGEWSVQLTCGRFLQLGQPPVSLVWRTPSGAILPSTSQHSGTFTFVIPNPPKDGDYACLPDNTSTSVACVDGSSPFHSGATVNVNGVDARLAIMEGRMGALQSENGQLTSEVTSLRQENTNLTSEVQDLKDRLQEVTTQHPTNCREVQIINMTSGVYTVYLSYNISIPVYCDMDTDGGGWTVIQRRLDGSVDFYRTWDQYEKTFGNLTGEFWLGLSNIHQLTSKQRNVLRVDLEDFDGNSAFAEYTSFSVDGADDNYTLHVSGFNGTAGDALKVHDNMQFTTYDRDNDVKADYNCAVPHHGAWWYIGCYNANLNGLYHQNGANGSYDGVVWNSWKGGYKSLKRASMKIRPDM